MSYLNTNLYHPTEWQTISFDLMTATKLVGTFSIALPAKADDYEEIYGVRVPKGFVNIRVNRLISTENPSLFKDRYTFALLQKDKASISFTPARRLAGKPPLLSEECIITDDGLLTLKGSTIEVDLQSEDGFCRNIQFSSESSFVTIPWNDRLPDES